MFQISGLDTVFLSPCRLIAFKIDVTNGWDVNLLFCPGSDKQIMADLWTKIVEYASFLTLKRYPKYEAIFCGRGSPDFTPFCLHQLVHCFHAEQYVFHVDSRQANSRRLMSSGWRSAIKSFHPVPSKPLKIVLLLSAEVRLWTDLSGGDPSCEFVAGLPSPSS